MEAYSATSLKPDKKEDEEVPEEPTIRFVDIIFLPFQPIFRFCILITVVTKCIMVSSYQRRHFDNSFTRKTNKNKTKLNDNMNNRRPGNGKGNYKSSQKAIKYTT